jgi:hypothetical protein
MEEALNETGFDGKGLVRGKHLLILNSIEESIEKVKKFSKQLLWRPLSMFTAISEPSSERTLSFSSEFEDCVHLLSLE